jgi:hypothetical protein
MPDNAPGRKIRGFILNGKNVGISSRSLGSIEQYENSDYDFVADDLEIICWDFVSDASNYGSEKMNLQEGNKNIALQNKKYKLFTESQLGKVKTLTEQDKFYINILGLEKYLTITQNTK